MSRSEMPQDPKGLIRESYLIDGIDAGQCRSIFLDWALGLPEGIEQKAALTALLEAYGTPGHPMTAVMQEGLQSISSPRRRGGWRARPRQ